LGRACICPPIAIAFMLGLGPASEIWTLIDIVHIYLYVYIYTYLCICICLYIYVYIYMFIHLYTNTYTHAWSCIYIYIYKQMCMCKHIYTYMNKHIYIHTYVYSLSNSSGQAFLQPVYCPGRLGTPSWGPQSNHGTSDWVIVKTLSLSCWAQIFVTRAELIFGPSSFQLWKIKFPRFWQRVVCPIPSPGWVV